MPQKLPEPIQPAFFRDRMLFLGMQDAELELLARLAEAHRYDAGEIVFREGDAGRHLYLIAEGEVEILSDDGQGGLARGSILSAWDSDSPLLSQYEGDFFGEMSVIDSEPRSATARARSQLVVYVLDEADLRALATQHSHTFLVLILNIARILSRRLRQQTRRGAAGGPNSFNGLRGGGV